MRITSSFLDRLFSNSLEAFLSSETHGLLNGVSERSSCGRLAIHLEREMESCGLSGYYADTEYNRKQHGEIKTILDDEMEVIPITCDVIVHSRGEMIRHDNLIAIEMKKSERPEAEKENDRKRLRIMTRRSFDGIWSNDGVSHPEHVCGYRVGVFVEVDRGDRQIRLEYFKDGRLTKRREKTF